MVVKAGAVTFAVAVAAPAAAASCAACIQSATAVPCRLQTCGRARCARGGCPGTLAACVWPRLPLFQRPRGGQVSLSPGSIVPATQQLQGADWELLRPALLGAACGVVSCCCINLLSFSLCAPTSSAADFSVSCALELHAALRKAAGSWQKRAKWLAMRCGLHAVRASVVLMAVAAGAHTRQSIPGHSSVFLDGATADTQLACMP